MNGHRRIIGGTFSTIIGMWCCVLLGFTVGNRLPSVYVIDVKAMKVVKQIDVALSNGQEQ